MLIYWISRRLDAMSYQIDQQMDQLAKQITRSFKKMSAAMDRLTQEVAETKTAVDSVITLVDGLAQQIRDGAGDPVAMNKLADDLDAAQTKIAEAVTANTPAEPPAEPPVEEPPVEEPPADEFPPAEEPPVV